MNCPRDNTTLTHDAKHVLAFHSCATCHGLWFEVDRLTAYLRPNGGESPTNRLGVKPAHRPALEPRIGCPQCSRHQLVRNMLHGVKVDICRDCKGIWLDAGELDAIVGWYRKSHTMGAALPAAAFVGLSTPAAPEKRSRILDSLDAVDVGEVVVHGGELAGEAAIAVIQFFGELLGGL